MNKRVDTVFVDLDGTLWDESNLNEKIKETVDENLLKQLPTLIDHEIELKGYFTWTDVYKRIGINYCDLIRAYSSQVYPFPGIVETLSFLKKNYSLWLTSDAGLDYTQLKLKFLGLTSFFNGIITSDKTLTRKSSQDWWLNAIKLSRKSKENIVVVGDSINDIVPPSELEINSICVCRMEELSFKLPHRAVHCTSFNEVPLILGNINVED